MLRSFGFVLVASCVVGFVACSDDEKTTTPGTTADSGAAGQDSGSTTQAVNGCTSYADGTTIAWGFTSAPPATCLKVKKGGTVTFNGDFAIHPTGAKGGDTAGSPFTTPVTSGSAKEFKFDTTGTFGFTCTSHSSMVGAIQVTD